MNSREKLTKNKLKTKNKPAGFWIRFLARFLDFLMIAILTGPLLIFFMGKTNGRYYFKEFYFFYIWIFLLIFFVFLFFIFIPLMNKGSTISYKILKIEINFEEKSFWKSFLLRETFFAWGWIFTLLLVAAVINHTLIFEIFYIKEGVDLKTKLSTWENVRVTIVGSFSLITTTIQMILAITIFPNKNRQGFHDKIFKAQIFYKNKFISIEKERLFQKIGPWKKNTYNLEYEGSIKQNDIKW